MTFEDLFHNLNQQTGQGAGAGAARPQRARKPRKAIGTPLTRTLLNLLVTLVVGAVYFYFALPALNPQDESFYGFLLLLCLVYMACAVVTSGFQGSGAKGYFGFVKKQCKIPALLLAAALVVCIGVRGDLPSGGLCGFAAHPERRFRQRGGGDLL